MKPLIGYKVYEPSSPVIEIVVWDDSDETSAHFFITLADPSCDTRLLRMGGCDSNEAAKDQAERIARAMDRTYMRMSEKELRVSRKEHSQLGGGFK